MSNHDIDRQAIMSRALRHGFTLREQPGGEMGLNDYVYAFAREVFEAGRLAGASESGRPTSPCQGHARQQEAEEAQHLTLVFKLPLTNMQRAVLESAEWTAASWSHAIRDRDAALKEAGCDQGQSAEIKSCDARALKVATARAFEYSGVNISLRDCHSRLIKNHDPDPCSYRMRITDPGCTGCADRDEDQAAEAGGGK